MAFVKLADVYWAAENYAKWAKVNVDEEVGEERVKRARCLVEESTLLGHVFECSCRSTALIFARRPRRPPYVPSTPSSSPLEKTASMQPAHFGHLHARFPGDAFPSFSMVHGSRRRCPQIQEKLSDNSDAWGLLGTF
eukprot:6197752-Pleurochrysis_carterae.AAC.1